jgi:hypothetical protein
MTRDPKIAAEYALPKNSWQGYPYCHRLQTDCILPEHPGEAKACFRCDYGFCDLSLKVPFNYNARTERLLKRIANSALGRGVWDEAVGKHYFIVNDERIYDCFEARDKWIAFELLKEILGSKGGLKCLLT